MNYIIFNNDGSIKNLGFADIIVQGDDNTDEIYCAIEGRSNDAYLANAYFELPNGDSNSLSGVASSFSVDGSTYQGYKITLTASQTVFAGNVRMSLRLEGTGIKWTYNVILTINASGYDPDEVAITMAQYANLVTAMGAKQDKYVINNARFYASLEAAQADLGNLAINQCFIVANPAQPSVYPKIYFKTPQSTAQELNTLGQFNTPTTNVSTSTLAEGSDATASVTASSSGNDWSLAFTFGIPKGDKGDKGDTGATGAPGQDGDYVSYNLGNFSTLAEVCASAKTYFQTARPYGQTCYGAYDGATRNCWFLSTKNANAFVCLRDNTPILCEYYNSQWNFTRLGPIGFTTGNLGTLKPGLYAIEYLPNGVGTTALTVMLSVTDASVGARSSRGDTLDGNEWHATYIPGVTNSIKIWDNGSEVSSPIVRITRAVNYTTTSID